MRIANVLLNKGLVRPDQLEEATELHRREGVRIDRALLRLGYIDERQLLEVMGGQLGIPLVDLDEITIEAEVLQSLPSNVVYNLRVVPVRRNNGTLEVATSDPVDLSALEDLRVLTGLAIQPLLAGEREIDRCIKTHFGVGGDTVEQLVDSSDEEPLADEAAAEDLLEMAEEASVVKLVNQIVAEAIHERASDIHIEPYERGLAIRYRIDGVLQEAALPPQIHRFGLAIISRIKILSHLNIAEKRLPQDGRFKFQAEGASVDVRVSVIPMLYGEGIVMRILDQSNVLYSLTELGMAPDTFTRFQEVIRKPHGIILVTGPTGSGKTTTLYAALQAILGPEKKVLTIEDPVEYHLDGVNQIPVNVKVGMSFARGLRAVLRHDPDVVMIGEIRDRETAEAATQAALTGHLVLSTLHTNDAASAATRLVDMGVEPYLVSSTLAAAMAQRLVRTICPHCKEAFEPPAESLPADFTRAADQKLYRGAGCRHCHGRGYRGRIGLYELMLLNDAVREKIMAQAPASHIVEAARPAGLRLLREDGWDQVRAGKTTPEEVVRTTQV